MEDILKNDCNISKFIFMVFFFISHSTILPAKKDYEAYLQGFFLSFSILKCDVCLVMFDLLCRGTFFFNYITQKSNCLQGCN